MEVVDVEVGSGDDDGDGCGGSVEDLVGECEAWDEMVVSHLR